MVYRIRDRVEFSSATSEDTLYVDPVAGNDDSDGTAGSPLATIQEAVYRFIPPYAPAPEWSRSTVNTVQVVYTPGMSRINETLHIPFHRGEGLLRIQAETNTVYSGLVQSGSLVADGYYGDGYYTSHHQLNLTTSPLTEGELVDGYFVTPQSLGAGTNEFERAYDYAPIFNNTADSLDIVLGGPGVYTGFSFVNSFVFDIVTPQIEWGFPDNNEGFSFYGQELITCDGGAVEISGFQFHGADPGVRSVISNRSISSVEYQNVSGMILSKNVFIQTSFADSFSYLASGSGIWVAGNIVLAGDQSIYPLIDTDGCTVTNLLINSTANVILSNCRNIVMIGLSTHADNGTDTFFIKDGTSGQALYKDLRNMNLSIDGCDLKFDLGLSVISPPSGITLRNYHGSIIDNISVINSSGAGITADESVSTTLVGEISGSANSGIVINNGSFLIVGVTGAGNGGYGIEMTNGSLLSANTSLVSITGASGDVKVGAAPVSTWGSGDVVDLTELCRLNEFTT